jgi:5,5'-dehydrodivanillate O-demethylase oxygenase subunit
MLTAEMNQQMTQVSAGTPMGELMRRYWQPIAAVEELDSKWTKRVRLLGEDLVLYRSKAGKLGLVGEFCPHRRASLAYGFPTEEGIRCPYHGWMFNETGACLDTPNEPKGSQLKSKIKTEAYPVEELGGLIFAYLGPAPAPLLPRYDAYVVPNAVRMIGKVILPINWLQIMENSVDQIHVEWLHGHLLEALREKNGGGKQESTSRHHLKIAFRETDYGITKLRLLEGQSEDSDDWTVGHPLVFPNTLVGGTSDPETQTFKYQIRVPVDDFNTLHIWYNAYVPPEGVRIPEHLLRRIPVHEVPYLNEDGEPMLDCVDGQDIMAWMTQGRVADRTKENLCSSDVGVAQYRRMLRREWTKVAEGRDPIGVMRDPAQNSIIRFPTERKKHHYSDGFARSLLRGQARHSLFAGDIIKLFEGPVPEKQVPEPAH